MRGIVITRTTALTTVQHAKFTLRFSNLLEIETASKEDEEQRAGRFIDWISSRISKRGARWEEVAGKGKVPIDRASHLPRSGSFRYVAPQRVPFASATPTFTRLVDKAPQRCPPIPLPVDAFASPALGTVRTLYPCGTVMSSVCGGQFSSKPRRMDTAAAFAKAPYTGTIWSSSFFERLVTTSGSFAPTKTVSSWRKPPTPQM